MSFHVFEPQAAEIFDNSIENKTASFSIVAERMIFLSGDEEYGFHFRGECSEVGKGSLPGREDVLQIDTWADVDLANNLG